MSRFAIARWARVSEPTVTLYEAKPESVGDDKRRQIARVYELLERTLLKLRTLGVG